MSSELSNDSLGRLAQLAAQADEAVREAVGELALDGPADRDEFVGPRDKPQTQPEHVPPKPLEEIEEIEEIEDLISMASGLDVGLLPDPPRVWALENSPASTVAPARPHSSGRGPKPPTMTFETFLGSATILLLLVGLFVFMSRSTASHDNSAISDGAAAIGNETGNQVLDAVSADRSGVDDSRVEVSLVDDGRQDVDLVATAGQLAVGAMPNTAWQLVGSEPGTAMITELVDPAWLQSTFEQSTNDDGQPIAFTFFAPSDGAIALLGADQLNNFAMDETHAKEFIESHIVDVQLTEADLRAQVGKVLITRSGLSIDVELDGDQVLLNGQPALFPSLVAANGTLIVIDAVLHVPEVGTVG